MQFSGCIQYEQTVFNRGFVTFIMDIDNNVTLAIHYSMVSFDKLTL